MGKGDSKRIDADTHNQRRRAIKARQNANKRAAAAARKEALKGQEEIGPIEAARRERRWKEQLAEKIAHRVSVWAKRMQQKVDEGKYQFLIEEPVQFDDESLGEFLKRLKQYRHDCSNAKAAALKSRPRWHWQPSPKGLFFSRHRKAA